MLCNVFNCLVPHFRTDCILEGSSSHHYVVNVKTTPLASHPPEFPGHVEQEGHGSQGQRHPLVVSDVGTLFLWCLLSDVGCA